MHKVPRPRADSWALGEAVDDGLVVQASVDTPQISRQHHTLEGLVDRIPVAEVRKVSRHPDVAWTCSVDLQRNGGFDI